MDRAVRLWRCETANVHRRSARETCPWVGGSPVGKAQASLLSHPVIGMYETYELERAGSLALFRSLAARLRHRRRAWVDPVQPATGACERAL